jgi:hypothetical protein
MGTPDQRRVRIDVPAPQCHQGLVRQSNGGLPNREVAQTLLKNPKTVKAGPPGAPEIRWLEVASGPKT